MNSGVATDSSVGLHRSRDLSARRLSAVILQLEFFARGIKNYRSMIYGDVLAPIIYLAFLAAGLRRSIGLIRFDHGRELNYLDFVFAGLVALITTRVWTRITATVSNDRKWGTYALKRLAGYSVATYLAGLFAIGCAVFLAQGVGLIVIGAALGVHLDGLRLLLGVAFGLVAVAFWVGTGAAVAMLIKNYQQRELVLTLTALPLIFSAPIFYSFDAAPRYLQIISWANPLSYQVRTIRVALYGGSLENYALVTCGLAVVGLGLAWVSLSRAELISAER